MASVVVTTVVVGVCAGSVAAMTVLSALLVSSSILIEILDSVLQLLKIIGFLFFI